MVRHNTSLPKKTGVYLFYNKEGKVIYVGKAKKLNKRVSVYFSKDKFKNTKTQLLVKQIYKIDYVVVKTESDALLLENNLIKKHQPKFNVLMKDDKTYPWICVKKEAFPRLFFTRKKTNDGSLYFGPYPSVKTINTLLSLIKQIYPIRTCNYELSKQNIKKKKFKVCLEYHLGNCKGACEGLETEKNYSKSIVQSIEIVKGNTNSVIKNLLTQMSAKSSQQEFEDAHSIKEKIKLLKNYQSKSIVVSNNIKNARVYSVFSDATHGYVNYLRVIDGAINMSHVLEIKKKLNESEEELLLLGIVELQRIFKEDKSDIIASHKIAYNLNSCKITIPKKGEKLKLVELSIRNAKYYRKDRLSELQNIDPKKHTNRILTQLKQDLHLKKTPIHIECFDNSNIQGSNPTSACVVFKNAKPQKKEYRHFNIKTVTGIDDFSSMKEVVFRRYKRLIAKKNSLPQLVIVDGGKGQLNAAINALRKLNLLENIAIIGIAKRLEEIYFPNDKYPLYLDKKSESLKLIQRLRNEAHRFSLRHHRNKRSANFLTSELYSINGIGAKTISDLLKKFKSVKRIKEAKKQDLTKVIGLSKANKIISYFS